MDLTDDPLAGVDASELEADIDRAIDELFVKKGEAKEPSLARPQEPAKKPAEEPKDEPAAEPAPAEPIDLTDDPLADLKESLLTLDWEITQESIKAFEKELQLVSNELSDDRHSMQLSKWLWEFSNTCALQRNQPHPFLFSFCTEPYEVLIFLCESPHPQILSAAKLWTSYSASSGE